MSNLTWKKGVIKEQLNLEKTYMKPKAMTAS